MREVNRILAAARGGATAGPEASTRMTSRTCPLSGPPYLFEASRPGVFAVGDVRGGNIKRVASVVGEGSIAVAFVRQVMKQ
jgi:hypothetical protein